MSSTPIDPLTSANMFQPDHVTSRSTTERRATVKSQSFLQALSDTMHESKEESSSTYVHPLVRKLSAKLSEKSLEMCTESLGSETGNDIIDDPMINSFTTMIYRKKEIKTVSKTKRDFKNNFPPPLTSVVDSVSMESYRENGRLVMNAVVHTETSDSLFHAQRMNGRLTLRLKKGCDEEVDQNEWNLGTKEEEEETKNGKEIGSVDLNENIETLEGNIGIDENMSRLGRCNETGGGERRGEGHLWNVETCWVAT